LLVAIPPDSSRAPRLLCCPGRGADALATPKRGVPESRTIGDVTLIPPDESTLEVTRRAMDGEYVFVVWKGESAKHQMPIGTDTFVVRDDKIVFQTWLAHVVDK
jgi:hypothetical protein